MKLKNVILFLFFCLIVINSSAQNFKGGGIISKRIMPYSSNLYSFTVELAVDWPQTINKPYIHLNWGDGSPTDSLIYSGSYCTLYQATTLKFTGNHSYNPSNSYTVNVIDSFFVADISNMQNSNNQKLVLQHEINATLYNNSPDFNVCLTDSFPCCSNNGYNAGAYDSDGDSLAYSVITPLNITGYTMPPIKINSATGTITFTNVATGLVSVCLKVSEWRKIANVYTIIGTTYRTLMFKTYNSVGIKNNEILNADLIIYPNPTTNNITIQNNLLNENYILNITNQLGQIIYTISITEQNQIIDLSFLSNSVYYLKINNSNTSKTFKLIKQ